jgi:hypothetical protein
MNKLFWIPFATGVFHGVSREQNKPPQWGITNSLLATSALYHTGHRLNEEWNLKPEVSKYNSHSLSRSTVFFGTITGAFIMTGSIFCLGHLLTKKAYPVFEDEYSSRP